MSNASNAGEALERLLKLTEQLRAPLTGCPWDLKQTHESLARYAIEEAYETADAIASGDPQKLQGELGDLLFQVVLHAQLGREAGTFDFAAIANGIYDKLVRRHPHVFDRKPDSGQQSSPVAWELHKTRERQTSGAVDDSALADIPSAAPALARATKLGKRAAAVGFDWQTPAGAREKIAEELIEVEDALAESGNRASDHVEEEFGDLLFTVAHWARHLGVDAETALRVANAKFERRFRAMERIAKIRQSGLNTLPLEALERLWEQAKAEEAALIQPAFTAPEAQS